MPRVESQIPVSVNWTLIMTCRLDVLYTAQTPNPRTLRNVSIIVLKYLTLRVIHILCQQPRLGRGGIQATIYRCNFFIIVL